MGILKKIGRELGLVSKPGHRRKRTAKPRAKGRRRMPPRKKNGEFKKALALVLRRHVWPVVKRAAGTKGQQNDRESREHEKRFSIWFTRWSPIVLVDSDRFFVSHS